VAVLAEPPRDESITLMGDSAGGGLALAGATMLSGTALCACAQVVLISKLPCRSLVGCALMKIVDGPNPPLRVFFDANALELLP